MSWKSLLIAAVAFTPVFAQEGLPGPTARNLTPMEKFAGTLKLDSKTQLPAMNDIFTDVAKGAAPIGEELLQLRSRLVNLELANKPAEDIAPVLDAYAIAAGKMAGLEASALTRVAAILKPDQLSKIPQAFPLMAGIFQPATPAMRAGRGPGGAGAPGGAGRGGGR